MTEKPADVPPELTFTEAEHNALVDYLNFVHKHAVFNGVSQKTVGEVAKSYAQAVGVVKKIETYIFEFKRTTKTGDK